MQRYVPAGEIEAWEKKDPLDLYESRLLDEGHATRADLDAVGVEVDRTLEEEIAAAEGSPLPEPDIALENVYAVPACARDVLAAYRGQGEKDR
jgi:TPP-dependent pyruvate/acetoin dehydrogenase alpha subunit